MSERLATAAVTAVLCCALLAASGAAWAQMGQEHAGHQYVVGVSGMT
jgi:hypothetical protein